MSSASVGESLTLLILCALKFSCLSDLSFSRRFTRCVSTARFESRRSRQFLESAPSPILLIDQSDNLNPILDNIIHNVSGCTQSGGWT